MNGLFGSYVRQQENEASDTDILVSFSREVDRFDVVDLKKLLEKKLNASVDLVMVSARKPAAGKCIFQEVEHV